MRETAGWDQSKENLSLAQCNDFTLMFYLFAPCMD